MHYCLKYSIAKDHHIPVAPMLPVQYQSKASIKSLAFSFMAVA